MANITFAASVVNELFERQFAKGFVDMVNRGYEVLDLIQKTKASFRGAYFEYVMNVAKQGNGRYQGEGAAQPTPRSINHEVVKFEVSEYIDKLGFTWRFLAQGDSTLLKSQIKRRIKQAVEDNRDHLDQVAIFGNSTRGFVSERMAGTGTSNDALSALGAAYTGLFYDNTNPANGINYDGDFSKFTAVSATDPATWVPVTLRAGDDYATAVANGHGANVIVGPAQLYVTGADAAAGTLDFQLVTANSGDVWVWNSGVIADGFALALELDNTTAVNSITIGTPKWGKIDPITGVAEVGDSSYEMAGIFHNLGYKTWGDKDRTTAAYATLRSTLLTMANSGVHARTNFTSERISDWMQRVKIAAGRQGKFSHLLCNYLIISRYIAALTSTLEFQVKGPGGTADFGVQNPMMFGYTPKECLNVPNGLVIGLNAACWIVLTVGGKMMDIIKRGDASGVIGGPLFKSSDVTTSSDTVLYGIHQLVCDRPNANGILCGISLN